MVHPNKRQKVEEKTSYKEEVLFNSDTLSKIVSYLPSVDLLNLALTCMRFSISNNDSSIIEESARIVVQDIATEEQLAALPHYDGESSLADYHYLQLLREPLTFDQLVGGAEYVNSLDKSCVTNSGQASGLYWKNALSNNILRAGKHYVTFEVNLTDILVGVMRPGQANQDADGVPYQNPFYQNFSRRLGHGEFNNDDDNSIQCCLYYTHHGYCFSSDWGGSDQPVSNRWEGMESMSLGDEIGMLLDLDEGTLSVYKNRRKLGVLKNGLAGPYCWAVSMFNGVTATIKRGTIPPN